MLRIQPHKEGSAFDLHMVLFYSTILNLFMDLSLLSYWSADQLCRIPPHAQLPNSCPTLDSRMGLCEVLEKMGEVVYRVCLPSTGRWVVPTESDWPNTELMHIHYSSLDPQHITREASPTPIFNDCHTFCDLRQYVNVYGMGMCESGRENVLRERKRELFVSV